MDLSASSTPESKPQVRQILDHTDASTVRFSIETSFGSALVANVIPPGDYDVWVAGFEEYPVDHRYYEVVYESLKDQFAHY